MGYDSRSVEVVARVSRHNDPRDDEHDALWEELVQRIITLTEDPRYADINPMVV